MKLKFINIPIPRTLFIACGGCLYYVLPVNLLITEKAKYTSHLTCCFVVWQVWTINILIKAMRFDWPTSSWRVSLKPGTFRGFRRKVPARFLIQLTQLNFIVICLKPSVLDYYTTSNPWDMIKSCISVLATKCAPHSLSVSGSTLAERIQQYYNTIQYLFIVG